MFHQPEEVERHRDGTLYNFTQKSASSFREPLRCLTPLHCTGSLIMKLSHSTTSSSVQVQLIYFYGFYLFSCIILKCTWLNCSLGSYGFYSSLCIMCVVFSFCKCMAKLNSFKIEINKKIIRFTFTQILHNSSNIISPMKESYL